MTTATKQFDAQTRGVNRPLLARSLPPSPSPATLRSLRPTTKSLEPRYSYIRPRFPFRLDVTLKIPLCLLTPRHSERRSRRARRPAPSRNRTCRITPREGSRRMIGYFVFSSNVARSRASDIPYFYRRTAGFYRRRRGDTFNFRSVR